LKHTYRYQENNFSFELNPTGKTWLALYSGQVAAVLRIRAEDGRLDLLIDGKPVHAVVTQDRENHWVTVNGQTLLLEEPHPAPKSPLQGEHPTGQLVAPMPGQVRAVQVSEGDMVKKGQTVLIVEAMKMEMKIAAQFDGVVKKLSVIIGQTVERDQILGVIQESSDSPDTSSKPKRRPDAG
jgi:biotin carboxyl carrier protein